MVSTISTNIESRYRWWLLNIMHVRLFYSVFIHEGAQQLLYFFFNRVKRVEFNLLINFSILFNFSYMSHLLITLQVSEHVRCFVPWLTPLTLVSHLSEQPSPGVAIVTASCYPYINCRRFHRATSFCSWRETFCIILRTCMLLSLEMRRPRSPDVLDLPW